MLLLIIILIISALLYFFFIRNNNTPSNISGETIRYDQPTQQEIDEADSAKIERLDTSATSDKTDTPEEVSSSIAMKSLEYNTDIYQLVIQTELKGAGWISCKVVLTDGKDTITKEVKAIYQSTFSSCLGFSIERSDFGTAGTWNVELTAQKSDGTRDITNASVVIP